LGVRFGLATRQTENTARLRDAKRQIARILTLLAEREQEV
jgi:ribosomal protein L29